MFFENSTCDGSRTISLGDCPIRIILPGRDSGSLWCWEGIIGCRNYSAPVLSGLWAVRTAIKEKTFELLCGSFSNKMLGLKNRESLDIKKNGDPDSQTKGGCYENQSQHERDICEQANAECRGAAG
jgi:hypothetical protein